MTREEFNNHIQFAKNGYKFIAFHICDEYIDELEQEIKSLKSRSCLNCEYRDFRLYTDIHCDFFEMKMPKDVGYCIQYKPDKEHKWS